MDSLTVSAIRSSFIINRVPDWHKKKTKKKKKNTLPFHMQNNNTQNPHVTQPSAHHHSTNSHVGTSTSFRLDISSLMQSGRGKLGRNRIRKNERRCCWLHSDLSETGKKKKTSLFKMFIFKRLSFLLFHRANPGRTSDICVCCFHLGLDLGRTGNFPRTGGDGSLLAASCPIAAGVLDATA